MREDNSRSDLIYGRNPVMEALRGERTIDKILIAGDRGNGSLLKITAMAKDKKIPIVSVSKQKLEQMLPGANTQGIVAYIACKEYCTIDDILRIAAEKNEKPFVLIADEIADPHNLGAMIRSADAFGVHGVIISKRHATGLTAAVEKTAGGALQHVAVAKVTNLSTAIDELKEKGLWIYGTDMIADRCYYEEKYDAPIALVIGSEGTGMGRLVKEKCDFLLSIPMKGKVSCLNASVAAGILMQEVAKFRTMEGKGNV